MAKPHGSLNVAAVGESDFQRMFQDSINVHNVYTDWRDGQTVFVRPHNTADTRNRILHPFKDKLIVEPTVRKTYSSGWIDLQWRRALAMLRSAEEIIIIGYSLPQQDFRPRLLIQLAGWDPAHQPPITLIAPHADQLIQRYEEYVSLPIKPVQESWIGWFKQPRPL